MKHSSYEISSVKVKHFGMWFLSLFTLEGSTKRQESFIKFWILTGSKSPLVQCGFIHTVQSEGKRKCMKEFVLLFHHWCTLCSFEMQWDNQSLWSTKAKFGLKAAAMWSQTRVTLFMAVTRWAMEGAGAGTGMGTGTGMQSKWDRAANRSNFW